MSNLEATYSTTPSNATYENRPFISHSYVKRNRVSPKIAKQNKTMPAPIPVTALLATLSCFDTPNEIIAMPMSKAPKIYKLAS